MLLPHTPTSKQTQNSSASGEWMSRLTICFRRNVKLVKSFETASLKQMLLYKGGKKLLPCKGNFEWHLKRLSWEITNVIGVFIVHHNPNCWNCNFRAWLVQFQKEDKLLIFHLKRNKRLNVLHLVFVFILQCILFSLALGQLAWG